jgi:hypothetical protein
MLVARPLVPRLSFGFDTFGPVYPSTGDPGADGVTVDGVASRASQDQTWAAIIAGGGTNNNGTGASHPVVDIICHASTTNHFSKNQRFFATFDLRTLTGATISAVMASLKAISSGEKADPLGITPNINMYNCSMANANNSQTSDYQNAGLLRDAHHLRRLDREHVHGLRGERSVHRRNQPRRHSTAVLAESEL